MMRTVWMVDPILMFRYFVTPLMDTTLERLLKEQRNNNAQLLNESQIKIFVYQIIRALKVYNLRASNL